MTATYWILVIWLTTGGAIDKIEFPTEAGCLTAQSQLEGVYLNAKCVEIK